MPKFWKNVPNFQKLPNTCSPAINKAFQPSILNIHGSTPEFFFLAVGRLNNDSTSHRCRKMIAVTLGYVMYVITVGNVYADIDVDVNDTETLTLGVWNSASECRCSDVDTQQKSG